MSDNMPCPHCGQPCKSIGNQQDAIRLTVFTMADCVNEGCTMYKGTFSFNLRPMTMAERADVDYQRQMTQDIIRAIKAKNND